MRMTLPLYLAAKKQRADAARFRLLCPRCLQPERTCYCPHIESFDPKIHFVILIHPLEVRRRIATGRMSHLILKNSQLIHGYNYSDNPTVNSILSDPDVFPVLLYPGRDSTNLSQVSESRRHELFPTDKKLVVFVLDGTWSTARKMLRHSRNLQSVPRICFTPPRPSSFRVRQQPRAECYSTIEAIHHTLELLGPGRGFDVDSRVQDRLLFVFDKMVEQQLGFIRESRLKHPFSRHHRRRPD